MNRAIYISGFMSAFLFVAWIISFALGIPRHLFFLIPSAIFFSFVYLPLVIRKRKVHKERMKEIIANYQAERNSGKKQEPGEKRPEGWGMNNSPFRNRNSGLEWGGGNIRASEASRKGRKGFLKK